MAQTNYGREKHTRFVRGLPVLASEVIEAGDLLVRVTASGFVKVGVVATGAPAIGIALSNVTGGVADGDVTVDVDQGVFIFNNDTTDPLTAIHIGGTAYVFNENTVSSDATGTSAAGTFLGFKTIDGAQKCLVKVES